MGETMFDQRGEGDELMYTMDEEQMGLESVDGEACWK